MGRGDGWIAPHDTGGKYPLLSIPITWGNQAMGATADLCANIVATPISIASLLT